MKVFSICLFLSLLPFSTIPYTDTSLSPIQTHNHPRPSWLANDISTQSLAPHLCYLQHFPTNSPIFFVHSWALKPVSMSIRLEESLINSQSSYPSLNLSSPQQGTHYQCHSRSATSLKSSSTQRAVLSAIESSSSLFFWEVGVQRI